MTRRFSKRAGTSGWLSPHLQGSRGWIDCDLPQEIDGGDHVPILADVVEMTAIDTGDPLVFHGDRLSSFRESTVG